MSDYLKRLCSVGFHKSSTELLPIKIPLFCITIGIYLFLYTQQDWILSNIFIFNCLSIYFLKINLLLSILFSLTLVHIKAWIRIKADDCRDKSVSHLEEKERIKDSRNIWHLLPSYLFNYPLIAITLLVVFHNELWPINLHNRSHKELIFLSFVITQFVDSAWNRLHNKP